jgi:integrase
MHKSGPRCYCHRRRVPIAGILRDLLLERRIASGRSGVELFFGRSESSPFRPESVQKRADKAWKKAGLERLAFHDCRHTAASLMIDAGVNAKALCTFMGHGSIKVTFDIYGHLMPGSEEQAASLLDSYFAAQQEQAEDRTRAWDNDGTTNVPAGDPIRPEATARSA